MKEIIASVVNQVNEANQIGRGIEFKRPAKEIKSILVCGLGGSGIGGKIVGLLLNEELKIPFLLSNDYSVPACVDESTLVIASSYSGNTEETLWAVRECVRRGAEIAVITSGGELLEMAKSQGWNHVVVPGGQQPRAMLVYSIVQQLFLLTKYGLISDRELQNLERVAPLLEKESNYIQQDARRVATFLFDKRPIIYSGSNFEGIAVRFRQQLNENAKVLCWHHIFPEMTHNELVGWAGGNDSMAVIFLRTGFDHPRTNYRWDISRDVIAQYTSHITEIVARGESRLEQNFYLIHLTDWVSYYLAELKKVDPVEVNIIGHLKSEMSKRS